MHIKTTISYHDKRVKFKESTTPSAGEDVEQQERSHTAGANVNVTTALQNWLFLKKLNIRLTYDSAIPLLDVCLKEREAYATQRRRLSNAWR